MQITVGTKMEILLAGAVRLVKREGISDCAILEARDLQVCSSIRRGEAREAQSLLHRAPTDDDQWQQLNALIHFCISGDSLVARSALARALMYDRMTADRLLKVKSSNSWQAAPGAVQWLDQFYDDPFNGHNRDSMRIAVHVQDQQRWKRWQDMFERAEHHLGKHDGKEAKKSFRAALREAERIDYSVGPFFKTLAELLQFAQPSGASLSELRTRIEARAARFDSDSCVEPLHAHIFHALGSLFQFMDDCQTAARYYEKAKRLTDHHIANNCRSLTLVDANEKTFDLVFALFKLERYDECLALLMHDLESTESYVGSKHSVLLPSLARAYQCYCHVGDDEGALFVYDRVDSIDETYFSCLLPIICNSCGLDHEF